MSELLKFQKNTAVCVDLETLSTRPNACIVSIGAVKFEFENSKIIDTFYINVDPKSCKEYGLHIDKSTIDWWAMQSKEARLAWQTGGVALDVAVTKFIDWWGDEKCDFWCNGLSFDAPIMASAFRAVGKNIPWTYGREYDMRTAFNMIGFDHRKSREKSTSDTFHNALDDAMSQTKNLLNFFGY